MASPTQAAQDAFLDQRLRRLERRAVSVGFQRDKESISRSSIIAQVSGLTLQKGVGTVRVSWDASPYPNVRGYVVQLADNADFTGADERTTVETFSDFHPGEGVGSTSYFARVKVRLTTGEESAFITGSSLAPGFVNTTDIEDANITTALIGSLAVQEAKFDSASVATVKVQDNAITVPVGAFTSGLLNYPSGGEQTVQTVNITVEDTSPIFVFGSHEPISLLINRTFTTRIKRDSSTLLTSGSIIISSAQNSKPLMYALIDTPPSAGTYTYDLTVEVGVDGIVANRTLLAVQLRK